MEEFNDGEPNRSPALWKHCIEVYSTMEAQAEVKVIYEKERLVWEGHTTKLFKALHLSVPTYSAVTNELKNIGAISQLRRGGGPTKSIWVLHGTPDINKYNSQPKSMYNKSGNRKSTALDIMQQQINTLRDRIDLLEKAAMSDNH